VHANCTPIFRQPRGYLCRTLAALRRCEVNVETGAVRISRQMTEQAGGQPVFGPPKSAAGQRTVIIPAAIMPDLAWHLARFAAPGDEGLLFTSSTGSPLHHSNFYRRVWMPALRKTGLSGVHSRSSPQREPPSRRSGRNPEGTYGADGP
jgi:hypothetical protein